MRAEARAKLLRARRFNARTHSHDMPFDHLTYDGATITGVVLSGTSPALHCCTVLAGQCFLVIAIQLAERPEGSSILLRTDFARLPSARARCVAFPLRLKAGQSDRSGRTRPELILPGMEHESEEITANLSPAARAYLASLGLPEPDTDQATAELIWYHALAIGYSPAYLAENADGIRQDWPRIPLPKAKIRFSPPQPLADR